MKRVKVSRGKYVMVSTELAEKAARVFASGLWTAEQVREAASTEPQRASVLIGRRSGGKSCGN